jgi:hypothetical protein
VRLDVPVGIKYTLLFSTLHHLEIFSPFRTISVMKCKGRKVLKGTNWIGTFSATQHRRWKQIVSTPPLKKL